MLNAAAVIFDLDGVLVDSYDAHFESWRRMYRELEYEYSEEAFARDFGRTSRDILRRNLGDRADDARIRQLDAKKEAHFRDIVRETFPAMDGAVELIDALVADGFRLGVGSSGPPENIALCLEKLGRAGQFGAVVTGADVTRGKPDPQVFQLAAERIGVPPASCVVVEDAIHGIEAAGRAGMKSVGITGTNTTEELAGADLVIASLREINPAKLRKLLGQG